VCLVVGCGCLSPLAAAEPPPKTAGSKPAPSLDDQLLKSLSDELLKDLDAAAPADTSAKPPATGAKTPPREQPPSALDRQLLQRLDEGEDVGSGPQDPLVSIGRRMRAAEELIGRRKTSDPTQRLQKQIVADLSLLVEQLQKQCSSGQCSGGQKPAGKPGAGSKKAGTGNAQASKSPAKDSVSRVGKSPGDSAPSEAKNRVPEEIWGQLPPRLREQLQAGLIEQFLPKYEKLIEDYYKRLAEERSDK
jgi:hypothetical protein